MEKRPHKMKVMDEIVAELKKEGKEVNQQNVQNIIFRAINQRFHVADRYGKLTGSDIAKYFREFYVATD